MKTLFVSYYSDIPPNTFYSDSAKKLKENSSSDKEKDEAWKKFQKDRFVTDKTIVAAKKEFEKEWASKNSK